LPTSAALGTSDPEGELNWPNETKGLGRRDGCSVALYDEVPIISSGLDEGRAAVEDMNDEGNAVALGAICCPRFGVQASGPLSS
jgi:hypothetical protein